MPVRLRYHFLSTTCLTLVIALTCGVMKAGDARANPADGVVVGGAATITSTGNTVDIHQSTSRAVINWATFNVAPNEITNFHQPDSSSITLNRVVGSPLPSLIDGQVHANGTIIIVNQNGVLFGPNGQVDANSIITTSADIGTDAFMGGSLYFDRPGNPNAVIENQGNITAHDAGLVGLVAPNVINSGVITARLGRVHLASGDTATIDLYGDGLLEVAASDALTSQTVTNTGIIRADGGTIALTAAAARETVNSVIKVSGELRAPSVGVKNGKIIIHAEGTNALKGNVTTDKGKRQGLSTVIVENATLDVSGKNNGEVGGTITITADQIALLNGTHIDASGANAGGTVHVGGEYLGMGITPTALVTLMTAGASIDASALVNGHGGEVVVYADNRTEFNGDIDANGAGDNGNGGFTETSGRAALLSFGRVRLIAGRNGKAGQWLLDPADITITAATNSSSSASGGNPNIFTATATASQVSAATIKASLDAGTNVTIQTSNDGYAGNGDITVSSAIAPAAGGTGSLTLSAYRNITVSAAITLQGGSLTLRADNAGNQSGAISVAGNIATNGGNITIGGGSGAITAGSGYAVGNSAQAIGVSIANTINAAGGSIVINGKGYNTTTNSNYGVHVTNLISTTGSGTVSINGVGQGNTNSSLDYGVYLTSGVTTVNGNISITGTAGGAGTAATNYGVIFSSSGGYARASGTGSITVSGTGGGGNGGGSNGIVLNYTNALQTNSGTINVTGVGGGTSTSTSDHGITILLANSLSTTSGNIILNGTGGSGTGGSSFGVIFSAGISLVNGSISITGQGGSGGGGSNYGVGFGSAGGYVRITGTGSITINGTGGATSGNSNYGVIINYADAVQTNTGTLSVTGVGGGTGSSNINYGISVQTTNGISSTGGGTITINGTGGASTSNNSNHGLIVTAGSITNTGSGTISINATGGGSGTVSGSNGVYVVNSGIISAVNGSITITGTGSSGSGGSNNGISVSSAGSSTIKTTGTGSLILKGVKGGGSSDAILISGVSNGVYTSGSGNITIYADTFSADTANSVNAAGILAIAPYTNIGMSIGSSVASTLNISTTRLGYITGASYVFGSTTIAAGTANTGDVTINTNNDFGTKNVSFISGGNIALAGALTKSTGAGTVTYLLQANGNITNTTGIGISASTGSINLTLNSDYDQSTSAGGYVALTGGTFNTNGGSFTIGGGTNPLTGNAYSSTAGQHGVHLSSSNVITTAGGAINIRGEASAASADMGVQILNTISSGTGSITIYGRSTSNNSSARSILMNGAASITSTSGNISITGVNASGNSGAYAFLLYNAGTTGGTISSTSGNITIDTSRNSNETSFGLVTSNVTTPAINTTNGNITILADTRYLSATGTQFSAPNGSLTFATKTAVTMGVGPSSGSTLLIPTSELGLMSAGSYIFGSTTTGNLTLNTNKDFGASNVTFISGGNISIAGDLTKSTGAGTTTYLLQANGSITNTSSKGITASTGAINLTMESDHDVSGSGSITLTSAPLTVNGGTITLNTNGQSITQSGTIGGDETINSNNGAVSIGVLDGNTTGTRSLTVNAGTATFTTTGAIGGTNKLNDLTVISNDLSLGANISGSGTLTLQPFTAASEVRINDATAGGTYSLTTTEIGYFVDGWTGITIGKSTGSGSFYMGTTSWADPVTFLNNFRTQVGNNLTATGNASVTFTLGASSWLNLFGSITTAGQNISATIGANGITGAHNMTTAGGNITINAPVAVNNTVAVSPTWSTSGGNINITGAVTRNTGGGSASSKTFTLNAGTGTVTLGSTVNGDYNLTGTGSSITFGGTIGGAEALGTVSLTSTNSLTLPSITAGSITAQTTGATSDITIPSGKTLTASGAGNAITIATGRNFINAATTPFNLTGGGRWSVYSADPTADTLNGLTSGFVRYGCTYGGSCPTGVSIPGTGNGMIYSTRPTLTITPSAITALTYGDTAPSLVGYTYGVSGYLTGAAGADSGTDSRTGTLTGTTTYTAGSNVGTYNINYSSGTLASSLGYDFTYANNASAVTVNQRTLTDSLTGTISKQYDGTNTATLAASNYNLGNFYGTDATTVTVATTAGTYNNQNAGTGKTVSVTGLTLTGAQSSNYVLSSTSLSSAIGTITQKPLTVTAASQTVTYGTSVPTTTLGYSGFITGENLTFLSTAPTITSTYSAIKDVATYSGNYSVSGGTDTNYSFTYVAGNLTVSPRALTVTTASATKDVSDPDPTFTGSNNLLAGDAALISWAYQPTGYSGSAGTYTIVANATDTSNRLVNYTRTNSYGTFTVTGAGSPAPTSSTTLPDIITQGYDIQNFSTPSRINENDTKESEEITSNGFDYFNDMASNKNSILKIEPNLLKLFFHDWRATKKDLTSEQYIRNQNSR